MGGLVLSTTALSAVANGAGPTTSYAARTIQGTTSTVTTTTTTVVVTQSIKSSTRISSGRVAHVARNHRLTTSTQSLADSSPTTVVIPITVVTPSTITKNTPITVASITTTTAKTPTTTSAEAPTTTTTAKTAKLTNLNPSANLAPNPNFLAPGACSFANGAWSCANPCVLGTASALSWPRYTNGAACTDYVLQAINNARAQEGIHPMVLPSNWYNLSVQEQLFVLADLERTARGLPAYVGINATLSANAQHAAAANADPSIAAGFAIANDAQGSPGFGGAWSGGFSILAADYIWMYDDAWGGSAAKTSNIACTSANAQGCWAHRDELLGSDPGYNPGVGLGCTNCEMGTGFALLSGGASYVDLIEIPKGSMPPMSFTWANNVLPYVS